MSTYPTYDRDCHCFNFEVVLFMSCVLLRLFPSPIPPPPTLILHCSSLLHVLCLLRFCISCFSSRRLTPFPPVLVTKTALISHYSSYFPQIFWNWAAKMARRPARVCASPFDSITPIFLFFLLFYFILFFCFSFLWPLVPFYVDSTSASRRFVFGNDYWGPFPPKYHKYQIPFFKENESMRRTVMISPMSLHNTF